MSKAGALAKKNALPSRESGLFKELLTLYETRQLKKGLKTSDTILKKFPDHGETLAMKGLILTHMGKRDEGIDLVKKGVRLDLMSHIVWHVFGLIQKGEKKYEEALKSYTQALRFDRDNMNLLRDSAQLQTHLRLYENLVETRHNILRLRPNLRQNWVGLAVAHHLNRNPGEARKVLEHYQRSLKNIPDYDVEHSETLLYYIGVLEERGDLTEALSVLDSSSRSRSIVDRTAILEARARLLSKQKAPEADEAWRALIEHNGDCYEYYRGFLENKGLSFDEPNPRAEEDIKDFSEQSPKAYAPKRLRLSLATGDQFKALVKDYIRKAIVKGIPSLFSDLKSLHKDLPKQQAIQEVAEEALQDFSPDSPSNDPTSYLWTLYFLAQHYSYLSQHRKALDILDLALKHTPTLPELHMIKGRVLKRAGDYYGAARCMNDARFLDGQDRFLNTKTGKYLLRAGMIEDAYNMFGMFTKKDAPSPASDLEDMQSLLFLTEEADAYRRAGKPNLALKKYVSITKVFDEFSDDQFDFHGYNLRKFTINIYQQMLTWEDKLRSHPAYRRAALEATKIFLSVSDDPSIHMDIQAAANQLTDAEKKAKKKAKKAAARTQDEKRTGPNTRENKELEAPQASDEDPDGMKLLGATDPLEQAAKLLHPLESLAEDNFEVWIAVYDVAIRRKKLLQALKALKRAAALQPESGEVHLRLLDLKLRAQALPQEPPAPIGPLFTAEVSKLIPEGVSLETLNSQYLQKHSSESEAVFYVAKASQKLGAPLGEVENAVFGLLSEGVNLNIRTALEAVDFLSSLKSSRVEEFRSACQTKFPLSTVFKSPEDLAALKAQVLIPTPTEGEPDEVTA